MNIFRQKLILCHQFSEKKYELGNFLLRDTQASKGKLNHQHSRTKIALLLRHSHWILHWFCMLESSEPNWWLCLPSKLPRYPPHHLLQAFDNARIWKSSFMTIKKEISHGNNWVRLFHALPCSAPCVGPSVFCPPPLPSPPHSRLGQWMAAYLLTYKWDSWCPQLLPFPRCQ